MNREETKKCIAVMQAYVDGETIELLEADEVYRQVSSPGWAWRRMNTYRVKPQPKLRPWTYDEIVARMAERPLLVRHKKNRVVLMVTGFDTVTGLDADCKVRINPGAYVTLSALCGDFEQHDGSPCGVVE